MSYEDDYYQHLRYELEQAQIAEMFMPVRCAHCHQVYDAGQVEVTARYADCSMWHAPCCGFLVDTRSWPRPHYEELRR